MHIFTYLLTSNGIRANSVQRWTLYPDGPCIHVRLNTPYTRDTYVIYIYVFFVRHHHISNWLLFGGQQNGIWRDKQLR